MHGRKMPGERGADQSHLSECAGKRDKAGKGTGAFTGVIDRIGRPRIEGERVRNVPVLFVRFSAPATTASPKVKCKKSPPRRRPIPEELRLHSLRRNAASRAVSFSMSRVWHSHTVSSRLNPTTQLRSLGRLRTDLQGKSSQALGNSNGHRTPESRGSGVSVVSLEQVTPHPVTRPLCV